MTLMYNGNDNVRFGVPIKTYLLIKWADYEILNDFFY